MLKKKLDTSSISEKNNPIFGIIVDVNESIHAFNLLIELRRKICIRVVINSQAHPFDKTIVLFLYSFDYKHFFSSRLIIQYFTIEL
jgi:hypothetical protein